MGHFSEQVHISIGSFTQNVVYHNLELSQKMADHHHFSFVWQYTGKAIINPADQAKALRTYLGDEVIFTFKSLTGIRLMSKGIITELSSIDLHGSAEGLHVKGISHSIVLDDMQKSRVYQQRGMDNIVLDILAEGPGEFYERDAIKSTYLQEFKYMAHYNETNFDFLKRLAKRYGQWFYFDGMRMQFGQTKTSKIKLINGSSLHGFKIQTNMASHKISLGGYDYNGATNIRNSSARTSSGSKDSFAAVVGHNQGTVTQNDLNNGAYTTNAQSSDEIQEMVKLQTAGSDANSLYYSGISYFPLGLGQVFSIINQTVEHELIVTEVTHLSQVHGNYACNFKAIPADVAAPYYTDVHAFAKAETQSAKVKDNNDPEGLGRVKVQFNWAGGNNSSEWIRMIQPHSGSGKGFYFIPEIGEEVWVGFEGSNAQNPYVLGTQYNGSESSGYADGKNNVKAIHTRSGTKIILNDAEGSILIEDPSGNTWKMDGQGNIDVNAPKNFTVNAGDNFTVTAGKNISLSAGENIDNSANKDIFQTAGQDISQTAAGDFTENANNKTEVIEQKHIRSSLESTQHAEKVSVFSTKENMLLESSQKTVEVNSAEKSNMF
ncbi:type VI secretion system Vgr family protein [Flavobacterium salmonis]|uniref:Type IV secretion protein Rhs n=1 Tax=Flavobacterium salmonis TaxID=2654844 RepID=A0A6V6YPM4_9FLAO|nr:phage baseplate assembly protein V [Flavobacterium salmonis]CAD0001437.1 type IV secretion protein Rhs [Flavobacterium salmonis]